MRKIRKLYLGCICLLWICIGCQQDETQEMRWGQVSVGVVMENSLSTRAEVAPSQPMSLQVFDADGTVVYECTDMSGLTEPMRLLTGEYTFKAFSATADTSHATLGEEGAFYEGSSTLLVEGGTLQEVKIVCHLAVAKVSVHFDDAVLTYFDDLRCRVIHTNDTLSFTPEEVRAGYFSASGKLQVALQMVNRKGDTLSLQREINEIHPCTHYHIHYRIDLTGKGDFEVVFDKSHRTYVYDVSLPIASPFDATLTEPDVYGKVAWLYATAAKGDKANMKFQYRLKGTADWVSVAATVKDDGTLCGKTNELDFATDYEYRVADAKEQLSEVGTFTTEPWAAIPNLDFETWTVSGSNYFMNGDAADSYWATGNTGVTIMKSSNTTYVEGNEARTGRAARMETISMMMVGSAAGNLFIGQYKTNMSDPGSSVTFGRAYAGARPLALTGYCKYKGAPVNNGGSVPSDASFTQDEGEIYIKVWNEQDEVIGEGHYYPQGQSDTYTPFTIPLEYVSKAKAAKLTIVCSSSRYGGVFSGKSVVGKVGQGSVLFVDDFSVEYYK